MLVLNKFNHPMNLKAKKGKSRLGNSSKANRERCEPGMETELKFTLELQAEMVVSF